MASGKLWLPLVFVLACGADNTESPPPQTPAPEPEPVAEAEPEQEEPQARNTEVPGTREAPAVDSFPTADWTNLLATYVNDSGFRYEALRANEEHVARLAMIVERVGSIDTSGMERDRALAFYINAYNVLTINSVLELWPVESVMQEEGFFDARTHRVAGADMTLNALENEIIRDKERFGEPRIHFAVNCASVGCPPLQREAFTPENLETLLASATQAFVRGTTQLDRRRNRISATKLFEWFADDFGDVREFIASQLEGEDADFVRRDRTRITHFEYDWALNSSE